MQVRVYRANYPNTTVSVCFASRRALQETATLRWQAELPELAVAPAVSVPALHRVHELLPALLYELAGQAFCQRKKT